MRLHSCKLQRHGVYEVSIGMKEFMHKPVYMGICVAHIYAGPPFTLFNGGIFVVELAPALQSKGMDDTII